MKILVLNCGSSSIKYQFIDMKSGVVLTKGIVEKIGLKGSFLKNERFDGDKVNLMVKYLIIRVVLNIFLD